MYGQTDWCTDRLTDVRTDWLMYRQTDWCTDRLTDVQIDNPRSVCVHMNGLRKTKPYSVLCFQGFWVKWEDHIWFWCCHKVTPNGVDVDAIIVGKVSHIENWHHPATKNRYLLMWSLQWWWNRNTIGGLAWEAAKQLIIRAKRPRAKVKNWGLKPP